MRRPVLTLLLLLSFVTFGIGLGRQAITDADEAYYAEASREMVASGDWLTPHFNFEDRWQKPVLYYWLTAADLPGDRHRRRRRAALVGALRRRPGAARVGRRRGAARRRAPHAWLAGAITATCFGYFAMARSALPDLPLAFCITLTIAAVFAAFDAGGGRASRSAGGCSPASRPASGA